MIQRVRLRTKESKGCKSVARPTKFGNPFNIEKYGRKLSVDYYRSFLEDLVSCRPEFYDELLDAEKIGCFCSLDEECHADVIIKYLEQRKLELDKDVK